MSLSFIFQSIMCVKVEYIVPLTCMCTMLYVYFDTHLH